MSVISEIKKAEKEIKARNSGILDYEEEPVPEMDIEIVRGKVYETRLGSMVIMEIDEEDGSLVVMDKDDQICTMTLLEFYGLEPEEVEVDDE